MMNRVRLMCGLVLAAALMAGGCSRGQTRKRPSLSPAPPHRAAEEAGGLSAGETEVQEASLRHKTFASVPELTTIYFEFDRDDLIDAARETLKRNADWLRNHPGAEVQVQGHCDQRGTTEYNLSLGQKRASAVRDFYRVLGIATGRMSTISYGEERLLCRDATEDCWSLNRRAETLVRAKPADLSRRD